MRNPSLQILFKRPTPAIVFPTATKPHVLPATRNLLASKRGPRPSVFNACHLPMCFARIYAVRALFEHLNFQKMSARGVLCTFWFRNVLPATTACTDSTAPLRRALRASGIFHVLTSKCASCHSGVQLFEHLNFPKCSEPEALLSSWFQNSLSATAACNFWSLIRSDDSAPAALASLLFDPPQPQNIGKTHCFAIFLPLRALINFLLALSSLMDLFGSFSSLALLTTVASSVHKSEVWLLNFLQTLLEH